jgi:hypothetical protein
VSKACRPTRKDHLEGDAPAAATAWPTLLGYLDETREALATSFMHDPG